MSAIAAAIETAALERVDNPIIVYFYECSKDIFLDYVDGEIDEISDVLEICVNNGTKMVDDYVVAELLLELLDDTPQVKYTLACIKAGWQLYTRLPAIGDVPAHNYVINIEYVNQDGTNVIYKGEYNFEYISSINIEDGLDVMDNGPFAEYGNFRFVYDGIYNNNWILLN